VVPHTSEVGLRIQGRTWEAFYAAAARGLLSLYGIDRIPEIGPGAARAKRIVLRAETAEELLVAWLGELNFHIAAKGLIPAYQSFERAGPGEISVKLGLLPLAALGSRLKGEIKSASFHKLNVRRVRGRWTGTVILDV